MVEIPDDTAKEYSYLLRRLVAGVADRNRNADSLSHLADLLDPPPPEPEPTLVRRMLDAFYDTTRGEDIDAGMNRVLAVVRAEIDSIEPDMRNLRRSDIDAVFGGGNNGWSGTGTPPRSSGIKRGDK